MLTAHAGHIEQRQISLYLQASGPSEFRQDSYLVKWYWALMQQLLQEKCGTESKAQASFKSWLVNPAVAASHTKRIVSTKVFCCPLAPGSYEEEMLPLCSRNHTRCLHSTVCLLLSRQQSFQAGWSQAILHSRELRCWLAPWRAVECRGRGHKSPELVRKMHLLCLWGQMLKKLAILCVWTPTDNWSHPFLERAF